jgi:hypothetical protein
MHRFLDLILVLSHRWEYEPPPDTLYNSRIFFIAVAGVLLHLDALFLLPLPSTLFY